MTSHRTSRFIHDSVETFGATSPRGEGANEDQFLVGDLRRSVCIEQASTALADAGVVAGCSKGHVLLVADGSGWSEGGATAGSLAMRTIVEELVDTVAWVGPSVPEQTFRDDLSEAMERCEEKLQLLRWRDPEVSGAGCSLTVAVVTMSRVVVAHAGSTRAYLLRHGVIQRITADPDAPPPPGIENPWARPLWNALGGKSPGLVTEIHAVDLLAGDQILLCTDGLTAGLSEAQIVLAMQPGRPLAATGHALLEACRVGGSDDDATIAIARRPLPPADPSDPPAQAQLTEIQRRELPPATSANPVLPQPDSEQMPPVTGAR